MSCYLKTFLFLIAIPVCICTSGCNKKEQAQAAVPAEQIQPPKPAKPVMHILFVGNEYTYANNMLYMIPLIAGSDPSSHFDVDVQSYAQPKITLAKLWLDPKKSELFKNNNQWDYIVIQPHHLWASSEGHVYISRKSISAWAHLSHQMHAQPVFFMTWPLEKYNPVYANDQYRTTLKNYKYMHHMIHGYSNAFAKKYDMVMAPIGDYWMHTMEAAPEINLYDDTGSNPSLGGSFLAALIIYKTLVDSTLDDITYIPAGMDEKTAKTLIAIASLKFED